jgi:hypothetical protein
MERKRDDKGLLVSDAKRFPSGIRKLSEYVWFDAIKMSFFC